MSPEAESDVLSSLVPELEAEGYDVYVHPRPPLAPDFLGEFQPDAIAIGKDKKLLIEIVSGESQDKRSAARIQALVSSQPGWELRIIYAAPSTTPQLLEVQSADTIAQRVTEIEELLKAGHLAPAFILGWAALEAAGRALLTDQFQRPQTPGRLIDVLAGNGYLTPSEADRVRRLVRKRNSLVHGEFREQISADEVQEMMLAVKTLLSLLKKLPS